MKRIQYIDSVKLIASLGIFVCHFWATFYSHCSKVADMSFLVVFMLEHVLRIFVAGQILVFLFGIISGWLAFDKNVASITDLSRVILNRYLRFFIPLFISNVAIFLMWSLSSPYSQHFAKITDNDWLMLFYSQSFGFIEVIKSSILLSSTFNGPLWMVRSIFLATGVIYFINFYNKGRYWFAVNLISFLLFFGITYALDGIQSCFVFVSVFIGYGFKALKIRCNEKFAVFMFIVPAFLTGGVQDVFSNFFDAESVLFRVLSENAVWNFVFALMLFVSITNWSKLQANVLDKLFKPQLSKLSFAIWIVHWPIICFFSCMVYFKLESFFSYSGTVMIVFMLSFGLLIFVSMMFDIINSVICKKILIRKKS